MSRRHFGRFWWGWGRNSNGYLWLRGEWRSKPRPGRVAWRVRFWEVEWHWTHGLTEGKGEQR